MELKITISEADFGAELKDILDSLSHEEKKEIAKEVMLKQLMEVTDTQRTLREKEERVFEKVKQSLYGYDKDKYKTPEQLRTHYKYHELMRDTKSAKEMAVKVIINSAVSAFREHATKMIQEDEGLKKIWMAASAEIRADFPKYIQSAMTYYFASQLQNMQGSIMDASQQSMNTQFSIQQIQSRLQQ